MPRKTSSKGARRLERVGSLMRALIANEIQYRLNDPRIPTITSVTRVEVSPDFAVARVYVSVMASEARRKLCLTALRSAGGRLRRVVGRELVLRRLPTLEFRLDESIRRGCETVDAIDRAMEALDDQADWEDDDDTGVDGAADHDEQSTRPARGATDDPDRQEI